MNNHKGLSRIFNAIILLIFLLPTSLEKTATAMISSIQPNYAPAQISVANDMVSQNNTRILDQKNPSLYQKDMEDTGAFQKIAVGYVHTCAVTQSGGIKCWGENNDGQLGDGTYLSKLTPIDVSGLNRGVIAIAASGYHSCALTQAGGVKCWGWNFYGELGDGTTTDHWSPVDVSGLSSGVAAITTGWAHTCALTLTGGVKCWGWNSRGQLGDGTSTDSSLPVNVNGLSSGVVAIVAGDSHTCALTQAGKVKCWGWNIYGQLGDGTNQPRLSPVDVVGLSIGVATLAPGKYHTCLLTQVGGVKCWGWNSNGQLGDGTTTYHWTPMDVHLLTSGVTAITAGDFHNCALSQGGGVKCWGWNSNGQLGDGTNSDRLNPVDVFGLSSSVIALAAGYYHTCAFTQTGRGKCWGLNGYGELGDGTTTDRWTPVDVVGLTGGTSGPILSADPTSIPADGSTTSNITLINAQTGHVVRLYSSRGSLDKFTNGIGIVNSDGQFAAKVASYSKGTAIINAQDITTGINLPSSTQVTITPVDGSNPPPSPNIGNIVITGVKGNCGQINCPVDGFFMLGLDGLYIPLQVSVDWEGTTPGIVNFSINNHTDSVAADNTGAKFKLDINNRLQEGNNVLRITAQSGGVVSPPYDLNLTGYTLPKWIMDGVSSFPTIGNQALILEIAFPGQPLGKQNPIDWGFPGELNQFQWQTNIKVTLPTSGGAFEVEISREIDQASTGHKPKAFLKLLGHETDMDYHGRMSGVLGPVSPYIIVQELNIGASISVEFNQDVGVVEAFNALPPFGPIATRALSAVPDIKKWLDDRAKLYIKITPELSGDFTFNFQPNFGLSQAQLSLDFPVELGAQVDLWVVEGKIYGGLGGKGTFGYSSDDIHIASLQGYGVGGYEFRLAWFSLQDRGDWKLAEYSSGTGQMSLVFTNPHQTQKWSLIQQNSTSTYNQFQALPKTNQAFSAETTRSNTPSITSSSTITSVLVGNTYTYTEPSLAVNLVDDHAIMAWVHDDVGKPVGQSQEIDYSLWNGATWSAPAGVTNDNFLDAAPQVEWAGDGKAVAVWERLPEVQPITATWDITTAQKIEIATASYNQVSGVWSPAALLTQNTALDMIPQIAGNPNGDLLAAWRQNQAGQLMGDSTHPDRIMTAFYYSGTWSTPAPAVAAVPGLVDLAAGYGSGEATLAYTRYLTPTGSITPTLQLFTSHWNGSTWETPIQRTDDSLGHRAPQVVYNASNQPMIVWLAGNELRLQNLVTSSSSSLTLPGDLGSIDQFRIVRSASGNIAAVFTAQAAQRDLYLAFYDQAHALWGSPRHLTDNSAAENYPTPAMDASGRLLVGYASTSVFSVQHTTVISGQAVTYTLPTDGPTDLVTLAHTFDQNLTMQGSAVSNDHPAAGSSVVVTATFENTGDFPLDNVAVGFYDGDPAAGGVLFAKPSLPGSLGAGSSATLSISYLVPSSGIHTLYAEVDPDHIISETNEKDNTANLPAFGPDLAIDSAGVDYWGASDVGLQAIVSNIGSSPTPTTTLDFYSQAITGTLLATQILPALQAGAAITLTAPWNFGGLSGGSYTMTVLARHDTFRDILPANNSYTFTLNVLPDLMVSPYYLWTTPLNGTNVTITTTVYNLGSIGASNVVVSFYRDWSMTDASLIFTQTIPYLGPASEVTISQIVKGPLLGGVYVQVNSQRSIAETSYANNLASVLSPWKRLYLPRISK